MKNLVTIVVGRFWFWKENKQWVWPSDGTKIFVRGISRMNCNRIMIISNARARTIANDGKTWMLKCSCAHATISRMFSHNSGIISTNHVSPALLPLNGSWSAIIRQIYANAMQIVNNFFRSRCIIKSAKNGSGDFVVNCRLAILFPDKTFIRNVKSTCYTLKHTHSGLCPCAVARWTCRKLRAYVTNASTSSVKRKLAENLRGWQYPGTKWLSFLETLYLRTINLFPAEVHSTYEHIVSVIKLCKPCA